MITPFGSGVLFAKQVNGLSTNPTPFRPALLQDIQVDIKGETKKLYGQYMAPARIRRAKIDIMVKSKIASVDPNFMNQMYFGCPSAAGIQLINDSEAVVVAADGTVTVANQASFAADWGMQYADGTPLLNSGAVAPAAGQYKVDATGHYSVNVGDATKTVLVSYTNTDATRGTTVTLANQLQGHQPEFSALLYDIDDGKYFALQLNECVASDISIPSKQGDFWVSSFDFEGFCDATNNWGQIFSDNA